MKRNKNNKKNRNKPNKELKELQEFLAFADLEKFATAFLEFGISSVDDMCDMSLITDAELMSELGMQKMQVRKFRRLVTEKNEADELDAKQSKMITKSSHVDRQVARESIGQNILSRRYEEHPDEEVQSTNKGDVEAEISKLFRHMSSGDDQDYAPIATYLPPAFTGANNSFGSSLDAVVPIAVQAVPVITPQIQPPLPSSSTTPSSSDTSDNSNSTSPRVASL
jgi:hypothetical protein